MIIIVSDAKDIKIIQPIGVSVCVKMWDTTKTIFGG